MHGSIEGDSKMQKWKLPLGLAIMMSVLALANVQPARAQQSCTELAERFDREITQSKGRRVPILQQARRISREGVELCATGHESDATALLITALEIIGVTMPDSASQPTLAERDCRELVEIIDTEARVTSKTRNDPNLAQARRIRVEGNALCNSGQQAEANALLLSAIRLISGSTMSSVLQTVIEENDCNGLLERLDKELGVGSNRRDVVNGQQARQLRSLGGAYCREGNQERANEVLVEAFRMIGRSVVLSN
jgi:hypothetical protein